MGSASFAYSASAQTFTVPAGITALWATVVGAGASGQGALAEVHAVQCFLAVTPGQVVSVTTGAAGQGVTAATTTVSVAGTTEITVPGGTASASGGSSSPGAAPTFGAGATSTNIATVELPYNADALPAGASVTLEWNQATFLTENPAGIGTLAPYYRVAPAAETFVVPAGLSWLAVTAVGGGSSSMDTSTGYGSQGATLATTIPATAGSSVAVNVGGTATPTDGAPANSTVGDVGWNGGGVGSGSGSAYEAAGAAGGGGATDVRQGGTTLANRTVVAGGAGGGVLGPSAPGQSPNFTELGGVGGTLGGPGQDGTSLANTFGGGGQGATQSAGGAGGTLPTPSGSVAGNAGATGALGQGGAAGTSPSAAPSNQNWGGGGGGGGYFGGGGGSSSSSGSGCGGAGGAGSSYVTGGAYGVSVTPGSQGGNQWRAGSALVFTWGVAPYAPTLASPAGGSYEDLAAGAPFTWVYNPQFGSGPQSAYVFRRLASGASAYQYWNGSSLSWQSSVVWNPSSQQGVTFPTSAWSDGTIWQWNVATQEANGTQGPFASSDLMVTAQRAGTVSITAPTSGGVVASPSTVVSWSSSYPVGASQTGYQVLVYPVSVTTSVGFTPGQTAGAVFNTGPVAATTGASVVASGMSPPNGQFVAYVQTTETGNENSAWASVTFTVSYAVPAVPAVTVSASTAATTGAPVVVVTVTGADGGDTFESAVATAIVQRSSDGVTWTTVRATATGGVAYGPAETVTIVDPEAALGVPVVYRAATTATVAGTAVQSAWSATATVTVPAGSGGAWWLTDPLDPTQTIPLFVTAANDVEHEDLGAFYGLGAEFPTIVADVVNGQDATITVETVSTAEYQTLRTAYRSQRVKLLLDPWGTGRYIRLGAPPPLTGIAGMLAQGQMTQGTVTSPFRSIQLEFVEVSTP